MADSNSSLDAVRAFFDRPEQGARAPYRSAVRGTIVREMLGPVEGVRILDLGCGDGGVSLPLLGHTNELTLVDLSPRMLDLASQAVPRDQRARVSVVHSSVDDFRPTAPFDIILCLGVLAHVPCIESTMAKIAEWLKSGGRAIVELTPEPLGWKRRLPFYHVLAGAVSETRGYKLNQMTAKDFVALATAKGLSLRLVRRHGLPLPGMSWWPTRWRHNYEMLTSRPWLARFGSEQLHYFSKD
jgi:2-polyprenyl-3-methyl-5-hydroxy-6-metoxy-1,4-benzoquinol methylase